MFYLMSCIVVMLAAVYELQKLFIQMVQLSDEPSRRPRIGLTLLTFAMCWTFTAPFLVTIYQSAGAGAGPAVSMDSIRWSVYLVLVGSMIVPAYAYLCFKRTPSAERGGFWAVGRTLALAGVVVVGVVSAISHLTFFKSTKDGIANIEFFREMAPLQDMANCTANVAFIQFREDGGPLKYRCPTLLVFGGFTGQPFAPWPDYVDGESQELATVLHDVTQQARKAQPQ